jgi:hypothetical protein
MGLFVFLKGSVSIHCHSVDEEGVPAPLKPLISNGSGAEQ